MRGCYGGAMRVVEIFCMFWYTQCQDWSSSGLVSVVRQIRLSSNPAFHRSWLPRPLDSFGHWLLPLPNGGKDLARGERGLRGEERLLGGDHLQGRTGRSGQGISQGC
jgi:hypothetical protein